MPTAWDTALHRVGKSGFGKGKGKDDSDKSKGKGKDYWNKGSPAGAGKGEQRPVGACSFCLDLFEMNLMLFDRFGLNLVCATRYTLHILV